VEYFGEGMGTERIEAFSDGVIAIIVTIMVLELRPPREPSLASLRLLTPVFLSYLLSFVVVAIMWVNHHHLLHAMREVNARVLWLNLNLLFWMSLIPFVTAWLGQNHTSPLPVAVYGLDLSLAAAAFGFLRVELARQVEAHPLLFAQHRRQQIKNGVSAFVYLMSAAVAFYSVYVAETMFAVIPLLYFVPEKHLKDPV
jgi:uncharacterized membrane protein